MTSIQDYELREPSCVLVIKINERIFYASLEKNQSTKDFIKSLSSQPLVLNVRDFDNFIKSADLLTDIKCEYKDVVTKLGDIVIFGNKHIGICYGEKKCFAFKVAHAHITSNKEFCSLFNNTETRVELYIEWGE